MNYPDMLTNEVKSRATLRNDIEAAVLEYLQSGGEIQKLKPNDTACPMGNKKVTRSITLQLEKARKNSVKSKKNKPGKHQQFVFSKNVVAE